MTGRGNKVHPVTTRAQKKKDEAATLGITEMADIPGLEDLLTAGTSTLPDPSPETQEGETEGYEGSREISRVANTVIQEMETSREREEAAQLTIKALEGRNTLLETKINKYQADQGKIIAMLRALQNEREVEKHKVEEERRLMREDREEAHRRNKILEQEVLNLKQGRSSTPTGMPEDHPPSFSSIGHPTLAPIPAPPPQPFYNKDAPVFKAAIPSSRPHERNAEVEDWLADVSNRFEHLPDHLKISNARASCRGTAGLVMKSSPFTDIRVWKEFELAVRQTFKVGSSSSSIFDQLHVLTLKDFQRPHDYYLEVVALVNSGHISHPRKFSEPNHLIRQHFLVGLPSWLRGEVGTWEDSPIHVLVDKAQCAFLRRKNARSTSPAPEPPRRWERSIHAVCDNEVGQYPFPNPQTPPRTRRDLPRSYNDTRSHSPDPRRNISVRGRRSEVICFFCDEKGHFVKQCPFIMLRPGGVRPVPEVSNEESGCADSTSTSTNTHSRSTSPNHRNVRFSN